MRIALVCPYSLSVPGGVQGQVTGLAASLRGLGHDVDVLAPADGPVGPGVNTWMATIDAPDATPRSPDGCAAPAAIDATCVPCPTSSGPGCRAGT